MISYILNFTLCSALLLGAYQLMLKNKVMFGFNRMYLIAAIILSLAVPVIIVSHNPVPKAAARVFVPVQEKLQSKIYKVSANIDRIDRAVATKPAYSINLLLAVYCVVSGLLLLRFMINLFLMQRVIRKNEHAEYKSATLILIDNDLTPHTFLNYIFLNKGKYRQHEIEPEILKHELAHARQLHSADVLFIELIWAICWFNPFLLLYRRAIQLNHEFLADEAAIGANANIADYQQLLLCKVGDVKSLNITSQFNYSVTKNRLIMMTKKTSATTAWICKLAVIPVVALATTAFCNKTNIPLKIGFKPLDSLGVKYQVGADDIWFLSYPCTKNGLSAGDWEQYMAIVAKYKTTIKGEDKVNENVSPADRLKLEVMYKQMSRAQQIKANFHFLFYAERYPKVTPAQSELNFWMSNAEYTVQIDSKRVDNKELGKYQPANFASVWVKDSEQKTNDLLETFAGYHGRRYIVNLLTTNYYNDFVTKHKESDLSYATYEHGDSSKLVIYDSFYSHR
ncbi:MAG: Signal transducer regulating beta-lactamase production, contains metallopeptidase domain [Mucilaginibacter sp.]|nr:Signal transducer regulating beta-lactamase production, contains metallopeptidase domain [Mucilaginibacter sp.]